MPEYNPDNIEKQDQYRGHTYTITRDETDTDGGYEYEFKLYIDGIFETTASSLPGEWSEDAPWLKQLTEHAYKQIKFLEKHA